MHDSSVVHCIFLLSRLLSLSFCKSLIHCKQWLTEVNWSNFAFHKRQYTFWSGFQVGFCSQCQSIIIVWYLISIFYLILCRIFCQKLSDEEEESTKSNVYMFDMFFSYSLLWSHFHWGVLAVGILLQVWSGGGLILKLVAMSNHWVYQHCIFKTDKISEIITQWSVLHKLLMSQH